MIRELTIEDQQNRHIAAGDLLRDYRETRNISESELPAALAFLAACKDDDAKYWKDKHDRKVTEYQALEVQFINTKSILDLR